MITMTEYVIEDLIMLVEDLVGQEVVDVELVYAPSWSSELPMFLNSFVVDPDSDESVETLTAIGFTPNMQEHLQRLTGFQTSLFEIASNLHHEMVLYLSEELQLPAHYHVLPAITGNLYQSGTAIKLQFPQGKINLLFLNGYEFMFFNMREV